MYENFILLGDLNISVANQNLNNFVSIFDLDSLIHFPTCYKLRNHIFIDLILTKKKRFMRSITFETGLSAHHKLTKTILRKTISKGNSKEISTVITRDLTKRNLKLS